MARGEVVLRQWNLLKKLQTRGEGLSLRELSEAFAVSERTIQRDFEILAELGFPIDHEEDGYGKRFWRLPYDFFRSGPLVLSLTEAISLHLAERLLAPLQGTLFSEGLQSTLAKIRQLVPGKALDYFAALDEVIYVRRLGTTDYTAHADTVRVLTEAIRQEVTVELTYRSLWRRAAYPTSYDPYGLVFYEGDLFALGYSHYAQAIRIFKITRISAATLSAQRFERPADFRLDDQFRDSFGITQSAGQAVEIVVRFTGPAAALVEERTWHESQQLEWLPVEQSLFELIPGEPDTLVAAFRLSNVVEFKPWIRGFGPSAEVLRPDWLRREIAEELAAAARLYQA